MPSSLIQSFEFLSKVTSGGVKTTESPVYRQEGGQTVKLSQVHLTHSSDEHLLHIRDFHRHDLERYGLRNQDL